MQSNSLIEVEETCSLLPLPRVGPIRRSEEAPGARATQAREYGDQQRQGSAGGGGEDATAGGVDRRVRVAAQAPGGQPLPTAIPGTLPLSHSLAGRGTRFVPPCRRPCPFLGYAVSKFSCARVLGRTFFTCRINAVA